ncbi:MAG: PEP-CTERM sorting domain-containing protein [Phycisphaerales bacterium JB052]
MDNRLLRLTIAAALTSPAIAVAGPIYGIGFENPGGDSAGVWSTDVRAGLGGPYTNVLGRFGNESVSLTLNATKANTAGLGTDQGNGQTYNITRREYSADRERVPMLDSSGGGNGGATNPPFPSTYSGPKLDLGNAVKNNGGVIDPPSTEPLFTAGIYSLTFDLMIFDSWDGNYEGFGPDHFSVDINGQTLFDELIEIHWLPNNFRMPDELPELNVYKQNWQDQIYRDITLLFEITEATDHFDFLFTGTLDQSINDESWGIDNIRVASQGQLRGASAPLVPAPGSLALMGAGMGLLTRRRR